MKTKAQGPMGDKLRGSQEMEDNVQERGVADEYGDMPRVHLDPQEVASGKLKQLQKLKGREVYSYVGRSMAVGDAEGKIVQASWALTEKGRM